MKYYLDIDGLKALIRKIIAADSAVKTAASNEIAAVTGQAGGVYGADQFSNYLKEATNLKDADSKLDAALKDVADDLAAATHDPVTLASGTPLTLDKQILGFNTGAGLEVDSGTLKTKVDGTTVVLDSNVLKSGLKLKYIAADGATPAKIALADTTGTTVTGTEISVNDIIGNGIISSSSYDPATGNLTLNFANGQSHTVNLTNLLDLTDVVIASGSTDYLGVATDGGENTGQLQLSVKTGDAVYNSADHTLTATQPGLLTNGSVGPIKDYVDYKDGVLRNEINSLDDSLADIAKTGAAVDVSYDNTTSGLESHVVQTAIDELAGKVDEIGTINPTYVSSWFDWEAAGEPAGTEPTHTPAA